MAEKHNYNTKARKYILEYLESCGDNTVCAADILDFLNKNGVSVNLTTVYRYLSKLTAEHKVIKITEAKSQKSVYQLIKHKKSCDNHLHIKCTKCGKLIHLDCGFIEQFREHILMDHGFFLECSGSILYGICDECK